jgi:hypothetical protein
MVEYFLNVIQNVSEYDTQTKEAFCDVYESSNCENEYNRTKQSLLDYYTNSTDANKTLFGLCNSEFILL